MPTPDLATTWSNIFDWVNPMILAYWPLVVYSLGVIIGFTILTGIKNWFFFRIGIYKTRDQYEQEEFEHNLLQAERSGLVYAKMYKSFQAPFDERKKPYPKVGFNLKLFGVNKR